MSAEIFQQLPAPILDLVAFVLGLNFGSFLNVLALRSLKGESAIWPASHCPQCRHTLNPLDTIPVLSYVLLQGKCRYCGAKISRQYPLVEVLTAFVFVAIERLFLTNQIPYDPSVTGGLWVQIATALQTEHVHANFLPLETRIGLTIGLTLLACTLIAVTVTDFKEKLIPHEITYPSMILGIVFSGWRGDLLGAMAGIGASYMLFDFLAFYGLQLYQKMHGTDDAELDTEAEDALDEYTPSQSHGEEPLEVMGGGDAVLSAVMSAYLGWQLLIVALFLGFIVGTAMGLVFLIGEMKKAGLLGACARRAAMFAAIGGTAFGAIGAGLILFVGGNQATAAGAPLLACLPLVGLGALTGALIGTVTIGTRVSKPFPFGPALALGGMAAMFLIPFCPPWMPLQFH